MDVKDQNDGSIHEAVNRLKAMRETSTEVEEPTEPVETTDEVETTSEEVSEIGAQAPETSPETTEAETEAETIELEAEQLAELLGLDPDRIVMTDDGLRMRGKVDGEFVDASPAEILDAYQRDAYLTNRSKDIAKLEKQHQLQVKEYGDLIHQRTQQFVSVLEYFKDIFLGNGDFSNLREDDPAEYAARKEEYRDREATFNQLVNGALSSITEAQKEHHAEVQKMNAQYLTEQREILLEHIPDWEKVEPEIVSFSKDMGFSDQEIGMMADSRLLRILHMASQYNKGKQNLESKKVKKIPKVVKPGSRPSKDQMSLEAREKAKKKFMQTGTVEDAVALLKVR